MIFNKEQNQEVALAEFRVHVTTLAKATKFDVLVPDIENAEYELRKIIGSEVYERAESEYSLGGEESGAGGTNKLVQYVQSAIANIAFRDYTVGNDLIHSQTGRKASVNPANEKQAWEFFIERDNEQMNYRIQKALNRLIDYLDGQKITEWTGSNAYKLKRRVLLSDIETFGRYYPIDNSLALFNQLLPMQMEMQRKHITPILGQVLLDQMLAVYIDETSGSGSVGDDNLLKLFDYAGPALALWTMATGMKRLSVKLLPEGLVQQFKSSVQSRNSSFPVKSNEKDMIIASLIRDAEQATSMLENQVKMIDAAAAETVVVASTSMANRNLATNKYFST